MLSTRPSPLCAARRRARCGSRGSTPPVSRGPEPDVVAEENTRRQPSHHAERLRGRADGRGVSRSSPESVSQAPEEMAPLPAPQQLELDGGAAPKPKPSKPVLHSALAGLRQVWPEDLPCNGDTRKDLKNKELAAATAATKINGGDRRHHRREGGEERSAGRQRRSAGQRRGKWR